MLQHPFIQQVVDSQPSQVVKHNIRWCDTVKPAWGVVAFCDLNPCSFCLFRCPDLPERVCIEITNFLKGNRARENRSVRGNLHNSIKCKTSHAINHVLVFNELGEKRKIPPLMRHKRSIFLIEIVKLLREKWNIVRYQEKFFLGSVFCHILQK